MTEQLTSLIEGHGEAVRRQSVLPKLARVVKKHSGGKKIAIERGIRVAEGAGRAQHLRDVLDQTAAPRMMVISRRCGATKAIPIFVEESLRQCVETRITE